MRKSLLVLSFTVLSFAPAWAEHEASGLAVPPGPGFRGGVVAVSHPLAAEAGARMLRSGGNAIDAAAALQFALNVVEAEFSGIGGGGFMMVHLAKGKDKGSTFAIEGRERAPATADTTLFTNPDGSNQGFTPASTSGQAVGVPGTLKVVATAVQRYGRMRLCGGDAARDRARRERLPGELRARPRRHRSAHQLLRGDGRGLPPRRCAAEAGPDPEPAGPREDPAPDREEGAGRAPPREDGRGDRARTARAAHRRQARPNDEAAPR